MNVVFTDLTKSMTNLSDESAGDLAQKVTQLDKELAIVSQESRDLQDQLARKEKDILQKVRQTSYESKVIFIYSLATTDLSFNNS